MIYEFRTYDLKPRSVPMFEERAAAKIKEGVRTTRSFSDSGRLKLGRSTR